MASGDPTSYGSLGADRAVLAAICSRYGIAELYVFGSTVRGGDTPTSDVDLLYVLAPGTRLGFALSDLKNELSELFGRPVDLVSKRSLHLAIRDDVLAEARRLHPARPAAMAPGRSRLVRHLCRSEPLDRVRSRE